MNNELSLFIKETARRLGFDACGIAEVAPVTDEATAFDNWIANGAHAGMQYIDRKSVV